MRLAIVAFICAILLPHAALAQEPLRYDPYGSRGEEGSDLQCSPGSYVVGMTGASGTNIDRIQIMCARIGPDGFALPSTESSKMVGGTGGAPKSGGCPPGTYFDNLTVWLTQTKAQVYFVSATCTREKNGSVPGLQFGAPYEPTAAFGLAYPTREFKCLPNMAVSGLTVRHGKHVNAIGVFCSTIVRQPAPVAVTPPPPVPPVVPKTVVDPGAPLVKQASFTGTWRMTKRKGGTFTLVINPIEANELTGTFTSADGKFNGTLSGTVVPNGRNFSFTYRTATGETGSGKMTYVGNEPKGLHFIGTVTTDGTPPVSDVWGGLRQ